MKLLGFPCVPLPLGDVPTPRRGPFRGARQKFRARPTENPAHTRLKWRMRAARGEASDQILVVAIDEPTGRWAGTMGGFIASGPDVTGQLLVGVYVSPDFRGRSLGVASAMLNEIEAWAAIIERMLYLHVHDENPRALAFYEREGYRLTGNDEPYSLNPQQRELEMVEELR